jgi:hypothetical protein
MLHDSRHSRRSSRGGATWRFSRASGGEVCCDDAGEVEAEFDGSCDLDLRVFSFFGSAESGDFRLVRKRIS